ncbi:MAG: hypothetical protein C5B56_06270 [Proteobacteria bacterium]|nr:MAG: hypothetical protein C5B56_06270 [Pseudomonadota bacterium]
MKYSMKSALMIVSLTTLCSAFIVVFSDSDNATRLFVGGDGAYVRTLVRQQYDWFGLRAGNLMNFWQGATNVYQYNTTGMAVFAGQTLLTGDGEINPVLTYTTAAVFLFFSAFLTGSFLSLPFGYSLLAGWILALLALPFFADWQLYPGFCTNPNLAECLIAECLILRLFFMIGRGSLARSALAAVAVVLLISHQAFFNSLHFVIIVPVVGAFSLLFLIVAKGRERRDKIVATVAIVLGLIVIGAPQYILGNALYSISGMLMPDLDPAQITNDFVSIVYFGSSYGKWLGPSLFVLAVIGAACSVVFHTGLARWVALLSLGFIAVYAGAGSLIPNSSWKGPMPIYFEIGLYPFYAGFAAATFMFAFNAVGLVFRSSGIGLTGAQWHRLVAWPAFIALCVSPVTLIAWSHGQPWNTGYRYPPERSEIISVLEKSIGLTPGGRFNGYVAPYIGFKDLPPGDPEMNPYADVELPLSTATGNDHRTVGLWYYNIPGLIELSSTATPPFFLFGTRLLARYGDPQFRHGVKFTKVNFALLQAIGVRYVITDYPLEEPAQLRRTMPTNNPKFELRLYELPSPNLGQYSPTQTFIATSATDALLALKSKIDLDQTVVVTEPLTGGLTRLANVMLFTDRQGVQVKAKSSSQSIAVIPIQFSQCLRLVPATPETRVFRANLMQTGLLFTGTIDVRIELHNGPFDDPGCRLRDYWDMKRLDVLGAARNIPRR